MVIKERTLSEAVTYTGSTYVGIRIANHSGSSEYHHLQDMKRIHSLPEFDGSDMKSVMMITVDGGPDCYLR